MGDAVLALDQGTTGSTALVLSHDGAVLGSAYGEIGQSYPEPGWVEQDPREIWETSRRVMQEAVTDAGLGRSDLRAIGITNQRETTVVWNRSTGTPVHPAIVWQSRQTAPQCDVMTRAGLEPTIREHTGLVIDPYFSGSKIRWILDRHPDMVHQARSGEILFGTIDTWLIWQLTGGAAHVTDPTNASRTLLYNIHDREWDPVLLDALDIPRAMLPDIRPSAGLFGETRVEAPVSGVPITGVAGDQQAALFGQGCWEPGMAKNTYGTGAFVVANLGQHRPPSHRGLLTTIACDRTGQPVLRTRRIDLRCRRADPVAPGHAGTAGIGGRERGDRNRGHVDRGGLHRAGLHRSGRTPLGYAGPRRHPRPYAWNRSSASCPGGARSDCLPDRRRGGGDGGR